MLALTCAALVLRSMVSAAFTLVIITVFGGLVYYGLERNLARAPRCAANVAPPAWR
jgi:hypothetical protein